MKTTIIKLALTSLAMLFFLVAVGQAQQAQPIGINGVVRFENGTQATLLTKVEAIKGGRLCETVYTSYSDVCGTGCYCTSYVPLRNTCGLGTYLMVATVTFNGQYYEGTAWATLTQNGGSNTDIIIYPMASPLSPGR